MNDGCATAHACLAIDHHKVGRLERSARGVRAVRLVLGEKRIQRTYRTLDGKRHGRLPHLDRTKDWLGNPCRVGNLGWQQAKPRATRP